MSTKAPTKKCSADNQRRPRETLILAGAIVIAACVIGLGIFFGYTQYAQIVRADAHTPEEASRFNPFGQIAEKFLSEPCAQMTHDWGNKITGSAPAGVSVFSPKVAGDPLSLSVEVIYPKRGVSYISADIRDVTDEKCSLIYDRTTHWTDTCALVAQHRFADYKQQRFLRERISYFRKGKAGKDNLFLIPVAQGCLSIEKGLLFTAEKLEITAANNE